LRDSIGQGVRGLEKQFGAHGRAGDAYLAHTRPFALGDTHAQGLWQQDAADGMGYTSLKDWGSNSTGDMGNLGVSDASGTWVMMVAGLLPLSSLPRPFLWHREFLSSTAGGGMSCRCSFTLSLSLSLSLSPFRSLSLPFTPYPPLLLPLSPCHTLSPPFGPSLSLSSGTVSVQVVLRYTTGGVAM